MKRIGIVLSSEIKLNIIGLSTGLKRTIFLTIIWNKQNLARLKIGRIKNRISLSTDMKQTIVCLHNDLKQTRIVVCRYKKQKIE